MGGDDRTAVDREQHRGSPMMFRPVGKREFGEVCHPRDWYESELCMSHRYTRGDGWLALSEIGRTPPPGDPQATCND